MRRFIALCSLLLIAGMATYLSLPEPEVLITYEVKRGDTLFLIAKAYGVSVDDLKRWNKLDSDLIEIAQQLDIQAGEAAPVTTQQKKKRPASRRPSKKQDTPSLSMPKAKPCLSGPSLEDEVAEDGYSGSVGLSTSGIKTALNAFLPNLNSCFAKAPSVPQEELVLDFRVGCDGQVQSLEVSSPGDWNAEMADCVTSTLRYTPFPAHALPDGDTFLYPIRMAQ